MSNEESRKARLGYIVCEDNHAEPARRWRSCYDAVFAYAGIEPHIVTDPAQARHGYAYVWRPDSNNFGHALVNTPRLSEGLCELANEYERRGAIVFPTSFDVSYYENKKRILELCEERSVAIPVTRYCESVEEVRDAAEACGYPLLFKHPYSCSSYGLELFEHPADLEKRAPAYLAESGCCIVQEQVTMSKDLRVNYVGSQALCSFWRVKGPGAFSSATRLGGHVDHFTVPQEGLEFAQNVRRTFGSHIAGIDMAWTNDDVTGPAKLLEISPIFDLNPMPHAPVKQWQKFKKGRHWKKLYYQVHLLFAARQIDYARRMLAERAGALTASTRPERTPSTNDETVT